MRYYHINTQNLTHIITVLDNNKNDRGKIPAVILLKYIIFGTINARFEFKQMC